jgi:hypothetical protein
MDGHDLPKNQKRAGQRPEEIAQASEPKKEESAP